VKGKMKQILSDGGLFINDLFRNRSIILELTKRDFTSKYIKNFFGLFWAIIDPLAFIVVLYFVFGMRFGNKEIDGVSYILYLICAYIAYDFFSSILIQASDIIKSYSFMVTKLNFRLSILPIVKLLSGLLMHMIILVIVIVILLLNSIVPSLYWFQIFYYIFSLSFLIMGLSWMVSSISLFFPDLKNIVNIIVRLLFFLTPIFWVAENFSDKYVFVMKFNPLYYIVNGYRESLVYDIAFWDHPVLTLYFWSLTIAFTAIGIIVFRRLRPHFADVI
jgi:lipopolysaccharide transport system permease protein/teichoic acid transport system permease protein